MYLFHLRCASPAKNKAKQSGKKARAFTMSQVTMCATAYPSQTEEEKRKQNSIFTHPRSSKEPCGQFDPSDIHQQQPCSAPKSIENRSSIQFIVYFHYTKNTTRTPNSKTLDLFFLSLFCAHLDKLPFHPLASDHPRDQQRDAPQGGSSNM